MASFNLPFIKPTSKDKAPTDAVPEKPDNELSMKLYKLIVDRYREQIEDYEKKSIADLKGILKPHDAKIIEIRDSITHDFHPYVYDEHFLPAAKMCFTYVSTYKTLQLPISFWLSFEDMQNLMAGDEIDKCILLCALLRSLGSENAKVYVTEAKRAYVFFIFAGKKMFADFTQKDLSEVEDLNAASAQMKGKLLYSFNDREHEDFVEVD